MSLTAVTYHTNADYAKSAEALVAGGKAVGVVVHDYAREDRGSWWANVAYKPSVIQKTLRAAKTPVLYLDADCSILGGLDALPGLLDDADLVVRHRNTASLRDAYNGGVMLFANNTTIDRFIAVWDKLVERYGHRYETCDQPFIHEAAKATGVRIKDLPTIYNAMPADQTVEDARIVHSKASRGDPALSAWKASRRLEVVLCEHTARLIAKKAPRTCFLWGSDTSLPLGLAEAELHVVDRVESKAVTAAWYTLPDVLSQVAATSPTQYHITATDGPGGNAVTQFRQHLRPKPSDEQPPQRVGLYYPAFSLGGTFDRRELCGPLVWSAATHCAALRGCRTVIVSCPDGIRPIVTDLAKLLKLKLTFA